MNEIRGHAYDPRKGTWYVHPGKTPASRESDWRLYIAAHFEEGMPTVPVCFVHHDWKVAAKVALVFPGGAIQVAAPDGYDRPKKLPCNLGGIIGGIDREVMALLEAGGAIGDKMAVMPPQRRGWDSPKARWDWY